MLDLSYNCDFNRSLIDDIKNKDTEILDMKNMFGYDDKTMLGSILICLLFNCVHNIVFMLASK